MVNFFDLWAAGHLLKDEKLESLGKMLKGYCYVDMGTMVCMYVCIIDRFQYTRLKTVKSYIVLLDK